ncbi:hypothetical protein BH10PSE6_BH10PSE6_32170 [soil metagenome]
MIRNAGVGHDPSVADYRATSPRSRAQGGIRLFYSATSARSWNQLWAWTKVLIRGDSARDAVS